MRDRPVLLLRADQFDRDDLLKFFEIRDYEITIITDEPCYDPGLLVLAVRS